MNVANDGGIPAEEGTHTKVIPAEAGIHVRSCNMDPRFRGDDTLCMMQNLIPVP